MLQSETISVFSPAGICQATERTPWVCLILSYKRWTRKYSGKPPDEFLIILELLHSTWFYLYGFRFLLRCTVKKILSAKSLNLSELFRFQTWLTSLAPEESRPEATVAAWFPWGGTWCVCFLFCVLLPRGLKPNATLSCTNWSSECSLPHKYLSA